MSALFNVGRVDRLLRLVLGIGLEVAAILAEGHPYARWGLALGGIAVILSGTCGI
jgi:Inner membrane protein YgaP-like, transmembrane domain